MKEFFGKIKKTIKNNYWLQPLLLVLLVFVLVFSLQGVPSLVETVKGWFNPTSGCKSCTTATYDSAITATEGSDDTYVLVTQTSCSACESFYPVVNKFLATYPDYKIYVIDVEYSDDAYNDSTLSDAKIYEFGALINVAITTSGYSSIYNSSSDTYAISTPTLVKFNDGKALEALVGSSTYIELVEFMEADQ
ncbi:MAG: thioredoxin family protein [Bacilli bacterium]|nr:thioredoxin family protein [Bacilli bacterium]